MRTILRGSKKVAFNLANFTINIGIKITIVKIITYHVKIAFAIDHIAHPRTPRHETINPSQLWEATKNQK